MEPIKKILLAAAIIIFLLTAYYLLQNQPKNTNDLSNVNIPTMTITSSVFKNNEKIPAKYTCDGANINPPLEFFDAPKNTLSFTLIMDDPDAPMGTWVHWTIWNIMRDVSPTTDEILENQVPVGAVEGKTSFGKPGYGGPCPPSGTHRYFFKIYALNIKLDLPSSTDKTGLEKGMEGHILAKGELIGLYSKD